MEFKTDIEIAQEANPQDIRDLSNKINITNSNLSILKTGKAKAIRFSTLNDLCRVLNCQPGDILEYIDDED